MKRAIAVLWLMPAALAAQGGATVEGKVVSASNGAPAPKAAVLLRATGARAAGSPEPASYLTQADSAGHFSIGGVEPGAYQCEPSREGYAAQRPDRPAGADFQRISVAEGQNVTGLVLRLTPLGVISGRVLDSEGRALRDIDVQAMQYAYANGAKTLATKLRTATNDLGEFRLFDLYPGAYVVEALPRSSSIMGDSVGVGPEGITHGYWMTMRNPVHGPAPPALVPTYFPAATDAANAKLVEAPAGGEAAGTDIYMPRRTLYSVRGTLPPGARNGPIVVETRPPDRSFLQPTRRIENDGTYEIPELPPGSYALTAMDRATGAGGIRHGRVFVEITDHDVDGVEFDFGSGVSISGAVKAAGKTPVKMTGLAVGLSVAEGGTVGASATVNADGTFTIGGVLPDVYRVGLGSAVPMSAPLNFYVTSIKLGEQELADATLDLRRAAAGSLTIAVSADMGRVTGEAAGDDGQPAAAAYVTLIPDQTKWDWQKRYQETTADAEGRFVLEKVAPGRYRIFSWKDVEHGAPEDADFRKPYESRGVAVIVEADGEQVVKLKVIQGQ
jgi:hypothetical protein